MLRMSSNYNIIVYPSNVAIWFDSQFALLCIYRIKLVKSVKRNFRDINAKIISIKVLLIYKKYTHFNKFMCYYIVGLSVL